MCAVSHVPCNSVVLCVAAVQGSGVMFKTVEVTLHKEGNSFGSVIRGEQDTVVGLAYCVFQTRL